MYIYGGFSYECATACLDLWRYEIPYAPQRYYPEPDSSGEWWNRGNHWSLVKEDASNSPGQRWKHTMISDYSMENLYLFGGIYSKLDSTNVYKNDMWKYYTLANKWELIVPFGINSISRRVNLWDGTFLDRDVLNETPEKYFTKEGDVVRYLPSNTEDTNYVRLPPVRAGHSMNLIGNPPYYILIYGGFNVIKEVKDATTGVQINIRTNLDDLWVFSLYSKKWHQVYVNSEDNPSDREDSKMVTVNLERLAIMYGGFYADKIFSETWYFNLFANMWQRQLSKTDSTISNSAIPPGLKGHTLVTSEYGVVLYGGQSWKEANLDVTDANYEQKSIYLSNCEDILSDRGLTVDEIGSAAFKQALAGKYFGNCFS